jgi:ferredoxin-nitrite reductase
VENISRRYLTDQPGIMHFATENGKAKFWARDDESSTNESSEEFPLILTNGRLPHQWHTRTKTGTIETLNRLNPAPFLQLHPSNAERLGIQNGDLVEVESKNGRAVYPAKVEDRIAKDVCFAPMHWNHGDFAVNAATADECDPYSLQPEFKLSAVKLTKLESNPQQGNKTMIAQANTTNDAFTNEQKEFLEGLMAGSRVQGVTLPGSENKSGSASAEPDNVYGTPIEDLSKEEKIKLEQNGLDVWGKMVHHAEEDKFPEGGDVFRFKYHGMFYVSPAQEAYMLRCRIPAGILTVTQMRGLAYIAGQWGGGYASITTRANIQIREFKAKNLINVLTKLYDIGLTSKGSGADNIRNVTASPTSGIDPNEVYDVRSLAKAMHHYILNHRDLYGLPRKFNIVFESGGAISVVSDTNDIAFVAVRVGEGHEVEPGVYFRVELGGITGHGDFARDSGILIHPSQCIPVAVAILRVFIENGDRTNRKKARMKYVLDKWGIEKYIEEVQKKLPFDLIHFPVEKCQAQRHTTRHGHIGIFKQSQPKLNYVGVAIPVGQMTVKQMRILAETAEAYGSGEIRLTVWQNLIIPNIHEDHIPAVERAIRSAGFDTKASSVMGGLIACTGNTGCKFASTNTKGQAVEIARYLEKKVHLDQPINIHLTGCPHSCAQHYCGDIGLLGVKVTDNGEQVEGYNIAFGGGVDQDQGIAKEVFKGIPFYKVPTLLERVLHVYIEKRKSGESFVSFTRRHEVKELQELFSN